MVNATLTQLKKSEESELRTPGVPIPVIYKVPPKVGQRFVCAGEGLNFGTRLISTSPVVVLIASRGLITFHTHSGSQYELKNA